ncbi:Dabb family protein [Planctomyces sp. SH-PL62]|uniref:Dabb family protein n=1 Tax=Planctomyces sp. SH-PL62 TaxID=1636152 RepID=UPI00078BA419|nr:Dabb family protein [Planctomyces sp. SH-PL62]AMV37733.1 Stress responsive A/B Barrel Domain protein [Planctomyces sp. SH-PL62]
MKLLHVAPLILVGAVLAYPAFAVSGKADGPALAHMVFFTLKDHSPEAVDAFVKDCEKYLTKHEGVVYFSVGKRAEDVEEPPSVKDFDVALHVVFAAKEHRDTYLASPRHDDFVAAIKTKLDKVRVFDSYLTKS